MSLVIVSLEPEIARIAVDTLSGLIDGTSSEFRDQLGSSQLHMSKIHHFVHAGVVLAGRGDHLFFTRVCNAFALSTLQNFDQFAERMSEVLHAEYERAVKWRRENFGIDAPQGGEITMVGWSPALNRMAGVTYTRWVNDSAFTPRIIGRAMVAPDTGWPKQPMPPTTSSEVTAIARAQVAWTRREHPGYAIGGKLMLAVLDRDSISIRTVADLEV